VACYGRQLGWLVEAVDVQAQRQSRRGLGEADLHAMDQVHALAERVAAVKEGITSTINAITTTMRSTARRAIVPTGRPSVLVQCRWTLSLPMVILISKKSPQATGMRPPLSPARATSPSRNVAIDSPI
jgi:hypothetical protein